MKKVKLYKVTCTESYMINEQGEGYKLYPWGNDTQDYKGHDDGGNYYVLPEGYEIAENNSGEVEIYKGEKHCEILMHHSGLPQLISGDKEMPVLKKLTPVIKREGKMRDYIVKQIDAEDAPIIGKGEASLWIDDKDLVPKGYKLEVVQNSPKLKTIFVSKIL